jgi:hypothetical protein
VGRRSGPRGEREGYVNIPPTRFANFSLLIA